MTTQNGVVFGFCQGVCNRVRRVGWIEIFLPLILSLIQQCFENRDQLQTYVQGERTPEQDAAMRNLCIETVRQAGVRVGWRVMANQLQRALRDELSATAGKVGSIEDGDLFQTALDEANRYVV